MNIVSTILKGVAMGIANVIPGVSGGTVAFILGIYDRLIQALKNIDINAVKLLLKKDFKGFFQATDMYFLLSIFIGIFISILSLAKIFQHLLDSYENETLAFFFGLILASIFSILKGTSKNTLSTIFSFIVGMGIAVSISFLPPAQSNSNFIYLVLCGIVAVCSMILPGLSGSYVLLLMGNYILVLRSIAIFDFKILLPIAIGCVVGLVALSRFLSYLFKKFRDITIHLMAGFVAGSLLIIWPWKRSITIIIENKQKVVGYEWELPAINSTLLIDLVLIFIGIIIVRLMDRYANQIDKTTSLDS